MPYLATLRSRILTAASLLTVAVASTAGAQQLPSAPSTPTTDVILAGSPASAQADSAASADSASEAAIPIRLARPPILSRRDLMVGGGITLAAVALFPLDKQITSWVRDPARLESDGWKSTLDGAEWGVEQGSYMAGAGLWVLGMATRNRGIAETGVHSLAAIATSQGVTKVLKGAFGRTRPYYSADSLPHDWDLGGGFGESDRRSFPSGHTSHAFAFATALSHEISDKWPRAGKIATPLLYTGATAAAVARVYNDKHWASDVTVGAAVGILSARATLAYLHGRPNNLFDRIALHTRIVPRAGGATLAVTLPTP